MFSGWHWPGTLSYWCSFYEFSDTVSLISCFFFILSVHCFIEFSYIIINKFVFISVAVIFYFNIAFCFWVYFYYFLLLSRVTETLANSSLWLAFTSYLFLRYSNPISSLILLKQFQYEHNFIQTLIIVSSYASSTTWMRHFLSMYFCKAGLEEGSYYNFLRFSNQRIFNSLLLMIIVMQ